MKGLRVPRPLGVLARVGGRRSAGKAEMIRLAEIAWEQENYRTVVILLSPFRGRLDFDTAQKLALAEVRADRSP